MDTKLHDTPQDLREEPRFSTADLATRLEPRSGRGDPTAAELEADGASQLFAADEAGKFRTRWEKVQVGFVDNPRVAVQQADELVAAVIKQLAEVFAQERSKLEHEWDKGDDVSTEDLRVALRRYRAFFDRLLAV